MKKAQKQEPVSRIYYRNVDKELKGQTTGDVDIDIDIVQNHPVNDWLDIIQCHENARANLKEVDPDVSDNTPVFTLIQFY